MKTDISRGPKGDGSDAAVSKGTGLADSSDEHDASSSQTLDLPPLPVNSKSPIGAKRTPNRASRSSCLILPLIASILDLIEFLVNFGPGGLPGLQGATSSPLNTNPGTKPPADAIGDPGTPLTQSHPDIKKTKPVVQHSPSSSFLSSFLIVRVLQELFAIHMNDGMRKTVVYNPAAYLEVLSSFDLSCLSFSK